MDHHALARDKKTADGTPRVIGYADEAAFYLVPSVGVTWARKGQTPVLRDGDRYGHLSVISLITETCVIRFKTAAIMATTSCGFCGRCGRPIQPP